METLYSCNEDHDGGGHLCLEGTSCGNASSPGGQLIATYLVRGDSSEFPNLGIPGVLFVVRERNLRSRLASVR